MSDIKNKIKQLLLDRKYFSESTLKTYTSLLAGVYRMFPGADIEKVFQNVEAIILAVDAMDRPNTSKATIFSALYGITGEKKYQTRMRGISAVVVESYKSQKMTQQREHAAMTMDEIRQVYRDLAVKAASRERTHTDITNALIAGLMSGVFDSLPPRRLMDYSELRFRSFSAMDEEYNIIASYEKRYHMVFNKYKTAASDIANGKGPATAVVPKQLDGLVDTLLMSSGPGGGFLLQNTNGNKFTPASLHARLLTIYGFGVDMLRSIYISDLHKHTPSIRKMEAVAAAMGHSPSAQLLFYTKK